MYVAAGVVGFLFLLGVGASRGRRKRSHDSLGVGNLSDSWLAEQRGKRDQH